MTKTASLLSRVSCGVGGVFSECSRQMALSFGLVFYVKVIEISSRQAGIILTIALTSFMIASGIFGFLCDKVSVPYLSPKLGRRKTWFLLSSILLAFFLLMSFSRCFLCKDSSSSWAVFVYYACAMGGIAFTCAGAELAHLSLIPVIAKNQDEAIILNSLR